jgi:SsrA-binding protein
VGGQDRDRAGPTAAARFCEDGCRVRSGEIKGAATTRETGRKVIASNKKARHDYAVLRTYEAGLVLAGTEVKSLRAGYVSIVDAFAQEHEGELMLYNLHIAEYGFGSWTNHAPRRTRKLLLHRIEIARILDKLREPGNALVPLSIYFSEGWAKVELALARGKREYDKRQALAERDANREIARALGRHLKGRTRG